MEQWIDVVKSENFSKHGEIIKFLKDTHGLTHGYANLVSHKARKSDAGSAENQDDLIVKQYQGKEHFKQLYDKLISEIQAFGKDIEIAPKKSYVSLRRKKQFVGIYHHYAHFDILMLAFADMYYFILYFYS